MGSKNKQLNRNFLDAIILRDLTLVRELLSRGADVHARDEDEHGESPVILATMFADAAMVRGLLDAGGEVDARDDKGRTALFFASVSSETFRVLVEAGADVHARDEDGNSILIQKVSECASLAEVEELLRLGIDPSLQNEDEVSALDVADSLGLVRVVERLGGSDS